MEIRSQIVEERKRRSLHLSFWSRFLVGAVLIIIIVNLVNARNLVLAFQHADIRYVLGAGCLVAGNIGLQLFKWSYMLRFIDRFSRKDVFASFLFGITLGSFTPGQIGEFGGRAVHLPSENRGTVIGLAVIDKLQVFGVMAIGGLLSILFLYHVESITVIALSVIASSILAVLLLRFSLVKTFLLKAGVSRLRHAWVTQAVDSLSLFAPKDLLITTLTTVMFYGVVYFQLFLLMNAFHPINAYDSFLTYAAMMFAKTLLPFSIADLGIREFGLVYFTSMVGYPSPDALAASLLLFMINIATPALIGLFFVPHTISLSSRK